MAASLLVLTDFFQAANRALNFATNLAGTLRARLVLLHVHAPGPAGGPATALTNLSPEAVHLALNSLTAELAVPVAAEVGTGPLPLVVADAVQRHHPLLLVLGRHAPLPSAPVASTAQQLLRAAPYPMLVVPGAVAPGPPLRRLLLAVDGAPFSLGAHTGAVRRLLAGLRAELILFHGALPGRHAGAAATVTAAVEDSVLRTGIAIELPPVRTQYVATTQPAEAIVAAAQAEAVDAVVLIARGRSFWGQLFHRSVTAYVLERCPIPVLVLPAIE